MNQPHSFASALSRREWLRRVGLFSGGAVALSTLPEWAFAHQPAASADQFAAMRAQLGAAPITTTQLTPNLTMLAGPGGNVVVLNGTDGKLVVDTFVQPAWQNLKAALDTLGHQRITTVIDTHWHFDHSDNNDAFRKEGAHLGDVFFNGMYPFIDATTGGSINGMIDG
jgi:glyoxylase-like metal-dependent hydrolase (beta-lactamase superfamily II)